METLAISPTPTSPESTSSSSSASSSYSSKDLPPRLLLSSLASLPRPAQQTRLPFHHRKRHRALDVNCDPPVKTRRSSSPSASPSSIRYPLRDRVRRASSFTASACPSSPSPSASPSPSPPLSPSSSSEFLSPRERWVEELSSFPSRGYTNFPLSILPSPSDPSRGLGVVALSPIPKHRLVLEYHGRLLSPSEKLRRTAHYLSLESYPGSYLYEFRWQGQDWARDATEVGGDDAERRRWGYGRYVNHSREQCNVYGRVIAVAEVPHLCFFSVRAIEAGEELLIDYSDRSRDSKEAHPWLAH